MKTLKDVIKQAEKIGFLYRDDISCRGYYAFWFPENPSWSYTVFETVKEAAEYVKFLEDCPF